MTCRLREMIGERYGMSKKIKVLIVDDSAVVRQTLAEIL